MKIHYVRSHPDPFKEVWAGTKQYEVRNFDREYAVGDRVYLLEVDKETWKYTGRYVWCEVMHVTPPGHWMLPAKLCVFGFEVIGNYTVKPDASIIIRKANELSGVVDACPVHMRYQHGCPYCEREGK